jgi:hypothetical protein
MLKLVYFFIRLTTILSLFLIYRSFSYVVLWNLPTSIVDILGHTILEIPFLPQVFLLLPLLFLISSIFVPFSNRYFTFAINFISFSGLYLSFQLFWTWGTAQEEVNYRFLKFIRYYTPLEKVAWFNDNLESALLHLSLRNLAHLEYRIRERLVMPPLDSFQYKTKSVIAKEAFTLVEGLLQQIQKELAVLATPKVTLVPSAFAEAPWLPFVILTSLGFLYVLL